MASKTDVNAAMASMNLNDEAEALKMEGNNLFKQKRWAEAAEKYHKATDIDPKCAVYWCNLAICFSKLNMYPEMQKAALKCHFCDEKSVKAYYFIALGFTKMMKYVESNTFLVKGLGVDPGNRELENLLLSNQHRLEMKTSFNIDVLKIRDSDQFLSYYGGLPPSTTSKIPKGTAYSKLKRTRIPILSKKVLKCRNEVNTLFKKFSMGDLRVAWISAEDEFVLECYLEDDDVPIIVISVPNNMDPKAVQVMIYTSQNPKWDRFLTIDERETLAILLSQRFLREKGYQVNLSTLDDWVSSMVARSKSMALYKHAIDLCLIYADVIFNRRPIKPIAEMDVKSNGQYQMTEMKILRKLAWTAEMDEDYKTAASLINDLLNAPQNGIQVDQSVPKARLYADVSRIHRQSNDYIRAEAFGVSTLRAIGHTNWKWEDLLGSARSESGFVYQQDHNYDPLGALPEILNNYQLNTEALLCKLRSDDMSRKLFSVSTILGVLLAVAGYPVDSGGMSMNVMQSILKDKYKTKKASRQAIANAFLAPSVEEYHTRILECKTSGYDPDAQLTYCLSALDPGTIAEKQSAFLDKRKAASKSKNKYDRTLLGITDNCKHCHRKVKSGEIKVCSCKMALYCSEGKVKRNASISSW